MSDKQRIALLIDCDNVSYRSVEGVLSFLAKYGKVNVRHAFGDWQAEQLKGWVGKLQPNAIRPMQQFAYTKQKNATDSAMIIDAMDLLYSNTVDAFALMTSDCDFTPLVMRLRESGLTVFGFGEEKTPDAFVDSCSQFVFIEKLAELEQSSEPDKQSNTPTTRVPGKTLRQKSDIVRLLRNAVEESSDDAGWSNLSAVGTYISNNSSFSPINYGYAKLGDIVREIGLFETEIRQGSALFVKALPKKNGKNSK
jgi:uncharacterized protein (TIGR00288 family)